MPLAIIIEFEPLAVVATLVLAAAALWWNVRWRRPAIADQHAARTALDTALAKLRSFAVSQGRFVGALADEIRAPLATGLIHAELLLAGANEPATVERYAGNLVEDMRHLSSLVEGYLRLAHPTAQADTSKHVPVHVHDMVLAAVRRCSFLASVHHVTIVPTLAQTRDGAPVEVLGDAVLLEAMLENLLRNAVRSSPRGARVELQVNVVGDEVSVSVLDRGAPMDLADVDNLFETFTAVPASARGVGSGLGLAIAMRVAEHHRGTLSLSNVPDGGCRFEVQLPRWPGLTPGPPA